VIAVAFAKRLAPFGRKLLIVILGFFARRHDLSHEGFVAYYEDHHVPLVRRLLPPFDSYRRCYIKDEAERERLGYDVVTEAEFHTAEAFAAVTRVMSDPEVFAVIAADEERFMDRSRSLSLPVDTRV
jgi:hypothetical protein